MLLLQRVLYIYMSNWVKENFIYERNAKTEEGKEMSLQSKTL